MQQRAYKNQYMGYPHPQSVPYKTQSPLCPRCGKELYLEFDSQMWHCRCGFKIDDDKLEEALNKIDDTPAVWEKAKQEAEALGIPWSFYQGLLTAARSLKGQNLLSANIDPKGWLKLTYQGYDIKLKIVEIDVVPNDK
jgi:ribosomal protein S27AE